MKSTLFNPPMRKSRSLLLSMFTLPVLIVSLAVVLRASPANNGPFVYVVTVNNLFGTVDLSTGAFHQVGPPTPGPMTNLVWFNGSLLSITADGSLGKINPATGEVTVIGPIVLPGSEIPFDLGGVGGKLFVTDFDGNIYSVNPATGGATFLRASGISPDLGLPFTPGLQHPSWINLCDESLYSVGGYLYATHDSFEIDPSPRDSTYLTIDTHVPPELYRIDPSTGAATLLAPTDLHLAASVEVNGSFYVFKLVFVDWSKFGPRVRNQLLTLDLSTGATTPVEHDGGPVYVDASASAIFGAAPVSVP
jgi:hypothetical protein